MAKRGRRTETRGSMISSTWEDLRKGPRFPHIPFSSRPTADAPAVRQTALALVRDAFGRAPRTSRYQERRSLSSRNALCSSNDLTGHPNPASTRALFDSDHRGRHHVLVHTAVDAHTLAQQPRTRRETRAGAINPNSGRLPRAQPIQPPHRYRTQQSRSQHSAQLGSYPCVVPKRYRASTMDPRAFAARAQPPIQKRHRHADPASSFAGSPFRSRPRIPQPCYGRAQPLPRRAMTAGEAGTHSITRARSSTAQDRPQLTRIPRVPRPFSRTRRPSQHRRESRIVPEPTCI